MPRYRLEYSKIAKIRFLSHRELMTTIQRALRRASFPLAYSRGFNPRPRFSFCPPLGVGVAGVKEYLDMDLLEEVDHCESICVLNTLLPPGLEARRLKLLPPGTPKLGKFLNRAWYQVDLPAGSQDWEQLLQKMKECSGDWLYRRPHDGKVFDIAAGVQEYRVVLAGRRPVLNLLLNVGSGEIPVRGLLAVLGERGNISQPLPTVLARRCGLYRQVDGFLVNPFEEVKELWEES